LGDFYPNCIFILDTYSTILQIRVKLKNPIIMSYSLSTITTVAECNVLLANANSDRRALEHKKGNLLYQQETSTITSSARQTALLEVTSELNLLDAQIASMPDGAKKEDLITDRLRVLARQRDLTSTSKTGSPTRIVDDQLEITRLENNIVLTNQFITDVQAKKAEIEA
jgi:hypothetical protein